MLKAQLQSQTAEITQLQNEKQEILRRSEIVVSLFSLFLMSRLLSRGV